MQDSVPTVVSSSKSTGGGGTFFEQHVDTFFLALLLVHGIPPIFTRHQVEEVHLQTQVEGWNTDDLLVVATNGTDERRRMAMQVKSRFVISSENSECKKAFLDFWNDFVNPEMFNPDLDCLVLTVLVGTDTLLNKFRSLLDCARSVSDEIKFAERLAKKGFLSQTAKKQAEQIKTIIQTITDPSDREFWRFLRSIYVLLTSR